MKYRCFIVFLILPVIMEAQEETGLNELQEQQLEDLAAANEDLLLEDDSYWQYLQYLKEHPLDLNTADADELQTMQLLSELQVGSFLQYRQLLGKLISVYELQAVPLLDIETIRSILPYVTIGDHEPVAETAGNRLKHGDQQFLMRYSTLLEKQEGYRRSDGSGYTGSRAKLFTRFRYHHQRLLQYGMTGDKDAGEPFFYGAQQTGFDFYSYHFFIRRLGNVKALAIGDYTVSMGQGLIQWQGWALNKNAAVTSVKRQGDILKPYTSAGEYNFHRGIGITWEKNKISITGFVSYRKHSANIETGIDAVFPEYVTTIISSGYHRTIAEIKDRHVLKTWTAGANVRYNSKHGQIGFNAVSYHFGIPLRPAEALYDRHDIQGTTWYNSSIDYNYTVNNVHLFGEWAMDKRGNTATINGMLISLHAKAEFAILYRHISKGYQSLFSNAFTENTKPGNEKGMYAGITIRPVAGWTISCYADLFRFPWLKYRVDAPSTGNDYFVQVQYKPNKQVVLYSRFRAETKSLNYSDDNNPVYPVLPYTRKSWRTQVNYQVSRTWLLRSRCEQVWYYRNDKKERSTGWLYFVEAKYHPPLQAISASARWQMFEADNYDARIYAYEQAVLYSFSIPSFFNRGMRYYINMNYKSPKHLLKGLTVQLGIQYASTNYAAGTEVGSGLDEIAGDSRNSLTMQLIVSW